MAENFLGSARSGEEIRLDAGQVLFTKGDAGHEIYVVRSGELQILDGNRVFETVGPGGIVGEMSLVDSGPRSATVRASAATEVVPMDERRFLFMVQQTPHFALRVMRVMSARLRAMNARLTGVDQA
ncbi:Crp/Fnr family transcriptional regulator [Taklimakanibacter deserti]|uniref:Crp/Fnr family transcriptional regulator n=1 Tax=Taklimakanibacter deserti TaxID=2267839 RepID=UPI0013C4AB57